MSELAAVAGESKGGRPASAGAPVVSMARVSKRFSNGTLALQDMSLDIRKGDFVSLLGPSGCGKSTALRIIAGLGDATGGEVHWRGGKPRRGDIGFVFQEPTLMPWATVFDNCLLYTSDAADE